MVSEAGKGGAMTDEPQGTEAEGPLIDALNTLYRMTREGSKIGRYLQSVADANPGVVHIDIKGFNFKLDDLVEFVLTEIEGLRGATELIAYRIDGKSEVTPAPPRIA
jgi:hypothetical protein